MQKYGLNIKTLSKLAGRTETVQVRLEPGPPAEPDSGAPADPESAAQAIADAAAGSGSDQELEDLQTRKKYWKWGRWGLLVLGLILVIVVGLTRLGLFEIDVALGLLGVVLILVAILLSPSDIDQDIEDLIIASETLKEQEEEVRSLVMFKAHQFELRRYYKLARQHSRYMLWAGLFCIGLGAVIVIGAAFVIANPCSLLSEAECSGLQALTSEGKGITNYTLQIIVGFLAAVGGILTNYVAAIYMKMYAVSSQSLNDFHNRLVSTHHLLLANFLVFRMDDGSMREGAIRDMVKELAKQ